MADTKILFSDLDGTLLDDDKNVSSEDIGSIHEMINAGHRFVIQRKTCGAGSVALS